MSIRRYLKHILLAAGILTLSSCLTRKVKNDSEVKGRFNSDFQAPNCKNFTPAPITDKWLKNTEKAVVKPIIHNSEAWLLRWRMIQSAKRNIDIQYYILKKDPYALAMIGLLRKKIVEDRVKVRIMIDTRGSPHLARLVVGKDYLQELIKVGAEVKVFNPLVSSFGKVKYVLGRLFDGIDTQSAENSAQQISSEFITSEATANHDKLLIIDDRMAIFGGRNISTKYFLTEENYDMATDDADVFVEGVNVVSQVRRAFLLEYQAPFNATMGDDVYDFVSRKGELEKAYTGMTAAIEKGGLNLLGSANKKPSPSVPDGVRDFDPGDFPKEIDQFLTGHYRDQKDVAILDNTSILQDLRCHSVTYIARKPENIQITTSLHFLMTHAQKAIYLMNQYFVPTPEFEAALDAAKKNRIPVYLITNSVVSDDVLFTQAMFQSEWESYARRYPNLKIYVTTKPAKLHTKMFVIDDEHSIVSSYNIDPVSQNINSEIGAYIKDTKTTSDLIQYMEGFIKKNTVEFRIENGKAIGMEQLYSKYPEAEAKIEKYKSYYPYIKPLRSRF